MTEETCECHGEAMRWDRDPRYTAGGRWRCRAYMREVSRRTYENLSGASYNRKLLKSRRWKALARRQRRTNSTGE